MHRISQQAMRAQAKNEREIPGTKFLHRGIHYTHNQNAAATFQTNATAKRNDHRDLMVHHQKINDTLQDIYRRTHDLEEENLTKEQREEQRWKAFERIGGERPNAQHQAKIGYAQHLANVRGDRTEERRRAVIERQTGDIDYSKGSALHDMKDRRIKKFQKRQVDRAHMLKRMGDPTPMKQSGKFDRFSNVLKVFAKTKRQNEREVARVNRERSVKGGNGDKKARGAGKRAGGGGSMWDVRDVNPNLHIVRDASSTLRIGKIKKNGKRGKKSAPARK